MRRPRRLQVNLLPAGGADATVDDSKFAHVFCSYDSAPVHHPSPLAANYHKNISFKMFF